MWSAFVDLPETCDLLTELAGPKKLTELAGPKKAEAGFKLQKLHVVFERELGAGKKAHGYVRFADRSMGLPIAPQREC
jgi:hypothetical protein